MRISDWSSDVCSSDLAAERAEYDRGIHIDDTVPVGQGGLFRSGNFDGRLATQRFRSGAPSFDRVQLLTGVPDQWKAVDVGTGKTRKDRKSTRLNSSH